MGAPHHRGRATLVRRARVRLDPRHRPGAARPQYIGDRFQGTLGAISAVLGILCMPIVVLIGIALIYDRLEDLPTVQAAIGAGASAAAGLVIGTALKMTRKLRPNAAAIAIGLASFVSVGVFHMPMALAIAVLGPLGIGLVWWQRR